VRVNEAKIFRLILLLCMLSLNLATKSQGSPDFTVSNFSMIGKLKYNLGDMMGMPFTAGSYINIRGSAYYIDSFAAGVIGLSNGKMYQYDQLKLNLHSNQLHFLTPDGQERVAGEGAIRKLYFFVTSDSSHPVAFSSGYTSGYGYSSSTFFEEMNQGNLQVLRQISRTIVNDVGTSSSPMGQHFVDQSIYYLADQKAKKLVKWKKGKEQLLEFLGPDAALADQFITEKKINCRSVNEVVDVLTYVNGQ